jgi:hypothetical protein
MALSGMFYEIEGLRARTAMLDLLEFDINHMRPAYEARISKDSSKKYTLPK